MRISIFFFIVISNLFKFTSAQTSKLLYYFDEKKNSQYLIPYIDTYLRNLHDQDSEYLFDTVQSVNILIKSRAIEADMFDLYSYLSNNPNLTNSKERIQETEKLKRLLRSYNQFMYIEIYTFDKLIEYQFTVYNVNSNSKNDLPVLTNYVSTSVFIDPYSDNYKEKINNALKQVFPLSNMAPEVQIKYKNNIITDSLFCFRGDTIQFRGEIIDPDSDPDNLLNSWIVKLSSKVIINKKSIVRDNIFIDLILVDTGTTSLVLNSIDGLRSTGKKIHIVCVNTPKIRISGTKDFVLTKPIYYRKYLEGIEIGSCKLPVRITYENTNNLQQLSKVVSIYTYRTNRFSWIIDLNLHKLDLNTPITIESGVLTQDSKSKLFYSIDTIVIDSNTLTEGKYYFKITPYKFGMVGISDQKEVNLVRLSRRAFGLHVDYYKWSRNNIWSNKNIFSQTFLYEYILAKKVNVRIGFNVVIIGNDTMQKPLVYRDKLLLPMGDSWLYGFSIRNILGRKSPKNTLNCAFDLVFYRFRDIPTNKQLKYGHFQIGPYFSFGTYERNASETRLGLFYAQCFDKEVKSKYIGISWTMLFAY